MQRLCRKGLGMRGRCSNADPPAYKLPVFARPKLLLGGKEAVFPPCPVG